MPNNNTANQFAGDFGTVRSTLLTNQENLLDLQSDRISVQDEHRRGIDSIHRKMNKDKMIATYEMAQMRYNDMLKKASDEKVLSGIQYGFNALNNYVTMSRQSRMDEEKKKALGSDTGFDIDSNDEAFQVSRNSRLDGGRTFGSLVG